MEVRYPVMPKERSREVRSQIRRVFLDVWDPIGIRDEPNAQDEYDTYVGRAFGLLVSDHEIESYLSWIVDQIGMDGSRASHNDVIAALRATYLTSQPTATISTE